MAPKMVGCCTKCDAEVFAIVRRDPNGLPIQAGAPLEQATRVTFALKDGSQMDLTFCDHCAAGLEPPDFPWLWKRVVLSWVAESGATHPGVKPQVDNGIMGLLRKQLWREVA